MTPPRPSVRCAIYTRKSTEEGLDQAFNTLHAQREACEAYIRSQAHAGWKLVKAEYDDGGFSGGTMERPALKRLLAEVAAGRIQTIVVYKIDRLTRSLADFARIVEILDGHGASFVSVTQQFNTTTSMGRLTLNVLLSFAQFEREVAGERIRDKIAASKARGLWMGGTVPLGYDVKDRALWVNEAEATTVRSIYETYGALGTVEALQADLKRRGVVSKRWTSVTGRTWGGVPFSRGALYWLLRNPVYIGQVRHKGKIYAGQHAAIVSEALWQRTQALLSAHRDRHTAANRASGRPLLGLLFDAAGNAMSPSWTTKRNGRRYAYYVSQALLQSRKSQAGAVPRVPAETIERLVARALSPAETLDAEFAAKIERVVLREDRVEIFKAPGQGDEEALSPNRMITVPVSLARRARAKILDDGKSAPDPVLLQALARAHLWRRWLERGDVTSYEAIAQRAGMTQAYVRKLLPLAFLAPDLTRQLLDGRRRLKGTLKMLLSKPLPFEWEAQLTFI
ncbi:MAG: recombinase family protein [Proteobacteria bacterium]|nr:recombinase family protein [Pseudomonadota bacterium]